MIIDLDDAQRAFQRRARDYLSQEIMTPDMVAELRQPKHPHGGGPVYWEKMRKLGTDGWIRLSWPAELGGAGATPTEQYLLVEEAKRAGFPWPALSANSIGPMLARHAHPEIRERVVGEILRGEAYLAIGYSEPAGGTDLANLTTRAVRDGDEWVINGQKIWTSCASFSQYIWLAARTDPDPAKRHKGLSVFLVPTSTPGFSSTPIETLGVGTDATYYQDVRIPANHLVGELNGGWPLITGQLNVERLSLVSHGHVAKLYDRGLALLKSDDTYRPLLSKPWVQRSLATMFARLEALRMLCLRTAWAMERGESGMVESSLTKIYGSELYIEIGRRMSEILGDASLIADGPDVLMGGLAEAYWRKGTVHTIGGGANEIQRTIVATAGLKMPRPL